MHSGPLSRISALDIRLVAAIAATLLLIVGVMWVVPTTTNSNSFTFDTARRGVSNARAIEPGKTVQGAIVDGSDADFYEIRPVQNSHRIDVRMTGSDKLIPGLRILNGTK